MTPYGKEGTCGVKRKPFRNYDTTRTEINEFNVQFSDNTTRILGAERPCAYRNYDMPSTTEPTYVEAKIYNQKVKILLDTGGGSSIISEKMANQLGLQFRRIPSAVPRSKFKTISNTLVSPETYHTDITLKLADKVHDHKIFTLCGMENDTIIIANEFL